MKSKLFWFLWFQVDAHAEECFFDKVKTGTKMGLMFEVAEGGFLDIDVRIEGPDGKIVHQVYFYWNSNKLFMCSFEYSTAIKW